MLKRIAFTIVGNCSDRAGAICVDCWRKACLKNYTWRRNVQTLGKLSVQGRTCCSIQEMTNGESEASCRSGTHSDGATKLSGSSLTQGGLLVIQIQKVTSRPLPANQCTLNAFLIYKMWSSRRPSWILKRDLALALVMCQRKEGGGIRGWYPASCFELLWRKLSCLGSLDSGFSPESMHYLNE